MARNVVSRVWDESKVNRDEEGKSAPKDTRGGGGGSLLEGLDWPTGTAAPVPDSPARHSTGRGMPSIVTGSDITVRGGKDIALDRHSDGSYTLVSNGTTVDLTPDAVSNFKAALDFIANEESDVGAEGWIGRGRANIGLIRKEGNGRYTLRVAEGEKPSLDAIRNAPPVELNDRDVERINNAFERMDASARIDTGYGDLDVYVTDNKKFGFRHLGDDGTPVDVEFNPKSFAKIQRAIDILIEGYDDDEDSPESGVTQVDVQTNLGKVRLELFGEWEGNGPGDYLTITPVGSDAWGIVVAGTAQEAFSDALWDLAEVGENQEFYDRGAGYR